MNKAVFFDRDGVVNQRIFGDYVVRTEQFLLIPEITKILAYLKSNGYLLILITNQQGVGKGLMDEHDLEIIHKFMQQELFNFGVSFDDIYFCTELAESNSLRRKPNPGMIFEAIEKYDIDVRESYLIGDSGSDILAGQSAGLTTILISDDSQKTQPDYHVSNHTDLMSLLSAIIPRGN
jgi:D-glycero-D-manno-heptose 1,7-bisphosphate phosphatase